MRIGTYRLGFSGWRIIVGNYNNRIQMELFIRIVQLLPDMCADL